jgi:hypothetical protein
MSSWASGLLSRVPAVMSVIVMEPLMMTSLTENVCSSTTSVPFDVNNRVGGQWAVCDVNNSVGGQWAVCDVNNRVGGQWAVCDVNNRVGGQWAVCDVNNRVGGQCVMGC